MARIHVRSWQEAYRGLVADEILDRPDFLARRERFWTAALSDERYAMNRPRAQAFYRKHGFRPDGAMRHDRDLRIDEIRVVRHEQ